MTKIGIPNDWPGAGCHIGGLHLRRGIERTLEKFNHPGIRISDKNKDFVTP
jgi:hypothetical protein